MLNNIKIDDKIKFTEEKGRYTVQARNSSFIICTKPYNPKRTVIYTIIDVVMGIRNRDNLVFCMGYETREQCEARLDELTKGKMELSHRKPLTVNIEKVN